ncbi:MAG: hypothetical protein ACI85O_002531 [Saprospiraceae bacterium]|jgi:hypothetical protein
MKAFITSLFLFFTVCLFAQPQKGDLYFGFSNFQFNHVQNNSIGTIRFNQSMLSLSPNFGKFIANNTLISGGFSFSTTVSDLPISPSSRSTFGLNLLCAQYFGKGKLKGLGQVTFYSNLTSNELFKRSLISNFALGGAYFVNDFTSIQLLYNINIFRSIESQGTEYFTSDLTPNIGLTFRTFLLLNREGIENLSALNSINRGTKTLRLSAGYQNNSLRNSYSYSGAFDYFFADKLYGSIGLSSFSSKNKTSDSFQSGNFSISLSAGYYFKILERLYGRFSTGINSLSQSNNIFVNNDDRELINQHTLRWNNEISLAFFLGRHKLEPGIGFRLSNTHIREIDLGRLSDLSPKIFLQYELFLAENFALSANANLRMNDVFYSPAFRTFPQMTIELTEFSQTPSSLNVGFKWYLSTPSE